MSADNITDESDFISGAASFSSQTAEQITTSSPTKNAMPKVDWHYFGKRYYGNWLGRWNSPDRPFADQHPENPQSWNLYMYAANRPTSLIDTNGREVKESTKTITYNVSGRTVGAAWNNAASVSPVPGGYRIPTSA